MDHDIEVPCEYAVGYEHQRATNRAPGPVASGGDHRVDERYAVHPCDPFHGAAGHQGNRIREEADKGEPEVCTNQELRGLSAGHLREQCIDAGP